MTERSWIPQDWLDEVMPLPQAEPEAFVEKNGDGWLLRPACGYRGEAWCRSALEPGQIVSFLYRDYFGNFTLTVREDRSWSADRHWPEQATHFWRDGEIFSTMQEAVDGIEDYCIDPLPAGEHVVAVGFWSNVVTFRFEVEGGKPRFVQVAGAN